MDLKKTLLTVGKFAIPVAIVVFLIYQITPEQWDHLKNHPKNYWFLSAALLVAIPAFVLSFIRWGILVRCHGIDFSTLEACKLGSICFLLNFVSAGSVGGDLFKAIFLARRTPGKRVEAVASVFVDRGVGMYGLLLIVGAGLLLRDPSDAFAVGTDVGDQDGPTLDMPAIKFATAALLILGTAVMCLLVFGGKFVDRLIRIGSHVPVAGKIIERIGPPLRMFHDHPIAFAVAILISVVVQSGLVVSMYLIAAGLYPDPPTFLEHFVIVPIAMLVSALPLTPAGVGVLEFVVDQLYRVVPAKVTSASGTLVALFFEVVKFVMGIIGTIFYWTAGDEVLESLEAAEEQGDSSATEGELSQSHG